MRATVHHVFALVSIPFFATVGTAFGAEDGTTTGIAAFHIAGEAKKYPPDVVVFSGTAATGGSYTDAGKGPLHFGVWECTLEAIIKGDVALYADGFCTVTDPEGDRINLRWERTDIPGTGPIAKTRGTYLSGSGKYTGIQGHYTFACRLVSGAENICQITGGKYQIP
jgi:hypothetical protein